MIMTYITIYIHIIQAQLNDYNNNSIIFQFTIYELP